MFHLSMGGIGICNNAIGVRPGTPHLFQMPGGGIGTVASSGDKATSLPRRPNGCRHVSRAGDHTHDTDSDSPHASGVRCELEKECALAQSTDCLSGITDKHCDYEGANIGSSTGCLVVSPEKVLSESHGNGAFRHDTFGSHVVCPLRGSAGTFAHAQNTAMVCSTTTGPSEAPSSVVDSSPLAQSGPELLERPVRFDTRVPNRQSVFLHSSVYRCLSNWMGRDISSSGNRRCVASLGTPHQPAGVGDRSSSSDLLHVYPMGSWRAGVVLLLVTPEPQ